MAGVRQHLESVNETYFQHLQHATSFGFCLIGAGFACLLHGLIPSLCTKTGSRAVCKLHDAMVINRVTNPDDCPEKEQ